MLSRDLFCLNKMAFKNVRFSVPCHVKSILHLIEMYVCTSTYSNFVLFITCTSHQQDLVDYCNYFALLVILYFFVFCCFSLSSFAVVML